MSLSNASPVPVDFKTLAEHPKPNRRIIVRETMLLGDLTAIAARKINVALVYEKISWFILIN